LLTRKAAAGVRAAWRRGCARACPRHPGHAWSPSRWCALSPL